MQREEAVRRVIGRLSGLSVPDDAGAAQRCIAEVLAGDGWAVQREVRVPTRGDGRGGRVDVVASCCGQEVAIEVDRERPRRKSVVKLRSRDWIRVIALRNPNPAFDLQTPGDLVIVGLVSESFE